MLHHQFTELCCHKWKKMTTAQSNEYHANRKADRLDPTVTFHHWLQHCVNMINNTQAGNATALPKLHLFFCANNINGSPNRAFIAKPDATVS